MIIWSNVKKHLLTGVSYMIPLVVASGLCMAIAKVMGGALVGQAEGTVAWYINTIGGIGMGLVVPVITAYMAFSIANRPGLAPGFICGAICVQIKAGFLGGIVAAFLVGYVVLLLKKYLKVPKAMQGLMPVMIIPTLTTLIVGLMLYLFIGLPIVWLQNNILDFMKSMQDGSRLILGGLIGLGLSAIGLRIFASIADMTISIEWRAAAAALVFCVIIGVAFGSYPAAKASKMTPIEALQRN